MKAITSLRIFCVKDELSSNLEKKEEHANKPFSLFEL